MSELKAESLRSRFTYNSSTGRLFSTVGKRTKEVKTRNSKGYIVVSVFGTLHLAHRVLWVIYYGYLPTGSIDHIDGDITNNKISNLRDVTLSENSKNQKMNKNNKSGVMGVYWIPSRNKWKSVIGVNKNKVFIGMFDNFEDAVLERLEAELEYGFHPNHGMR